MELAVQQRIPGRAAWLVDFDREQHPTALEFDLPCGQEGEFLGLFKMACLCAGSGSAWIRRGEATYHVMEWCRLRRDDLRLMNTELHNKYS